MRSLSSIPAPGRDRTSVALTLLALALVALLRLVAG
jgi:hypothetical protein